MSRKSCLIVGAGNGLGRALAARFALGGYDIALVSRSREGSQPALDDVRAANAEVEATFHAGDVTQPEALEDVIRGIGTETGNPEVMIYNVRGEFRQCAPLEMSYDDLRRSLDLEVIGAYAAARSVLPSMIQRGRGCILFSSATAAFRGSATYPLYAIGKFGLRALSQSLARAHAPDGVHVAHIRLDCDLDMPLMKEMYGDRYDPERLADPADVAETYWWVHQQPRSAWSNEVELRPNTETWTL